MESSHLPISGRWGIILLGLGGGTLNFHLLLRGLSQMGDLKFPICLGGRRTKDKVCSSFFAYSNLNSTLLLKILFQISIMTSKTY